MVVCWLNTISTRLRLSTVAHCGENPNHCPASVRRCWYRAVCGSQGQDRVLQWAGEISRDLHVTPSLAHAHAHAHSHASLVVARRASARCPSAWPRPTCLCPTCPTRRERRAASSCPSETSEPASGPDSSTRWWGRWVQLVYFPKILYKTQSSLPRHVNSSPNFL